MDTTEILNDIEKAKIIAFCEDTIMREAVRKVLLSGVYQNGTLKAGVPADPRKNFALSLAWVASSRDIPNEILGQDLRAVAEGIRVVESAFNKLSEYKHDEIAGEEKENPAL